MAPHVGPAEAASRLECSEYSWSTSAHMAQCVQSKSADPACLLCITLRLLRCQQWGGWHGAQGSALKASSLLMHLAATRMPLVAPRDHSKQHRNPVLVLLSRPCPEPVPGGPRNPLLVLLPRPCPEPIPSGPRNPVLVLPMFRANRNSPLPLNLL